MNETKSPYMQHSRHDDGRMNREEAIFYIKELQKTCASMDKKVAEAVDMAIEALQEPKTIIGIDIPFYGERREP